MEIPKDWKIVPLVHEGKKKISITFEKNQQSILLVRKIPGARWCYSLKRWLVNDNTQVRHLLGMEQYDRVRDIANSCGNLNAEQKAALNRLIDYMRNYRYSESTIRSYVQTLSVFFEYYPNEPLQSISNEHLIDFNRDYVLRKKLSASYQSQFVNALKLLYGQIIQSKIDVEKLVRPKKPFQLPKVLSEEEVAAILNACDNSKHHMMLSLMYSAGLRRGELLNLMITDIDSNRMVIQIRSGKGAKDRLVPLSPRILELLREYYRQYKPSQWLFEGQYGGRYSERSIELVIKKAVEAAGIRKNINLHMLRHSYATHLMESGTNLRYIQELLGHKSPKTTQIYTHVSRDMLSKVTSPFDKLNLGGGGKTKKTK